MAETVNQEVTTPAAEGQQNERTFTQAEMNAIITERLNRERAKYADYDTLKSKAAQFDAAEEAGKTELQKANEKAAVLQAQLEQLTRANTLREVRAKVSASTGVPAELLSGETEEDCAAQAAAILKFAKPGGSVGVTSADLTDTRLDEELCGIMRDGVTGIPTDQLLQQAQARLDELETPAEEYVKDISLSGNTLTLTRGNGQTESFELAEGYTLPAATYSKLGGVIVGTNLSITSAGVLSAIDGASIVSQSIGETDSYIRLSNGVQICWGFASYKYVTFLVPFLNDNSVGFASHLSYSGSTRLVNATKSILSSNFLDWIAIGLWK